MSTTLPLYWNLSAPGEDVRIDSSARLLHVVLDIQSQFLQSNQDASPSTEKDMQVDDSESDEDEDMAEATEDALETGVPVVYQDEDESEDEIQSISNALNCEDVQYALRRLIRGLASPRDSSRIGFSVALTELLSRLNTISPSQVISSILSFSQTSGSMQGHEIRNQMFGRLFGFMALVRSGLLYSKSSRLEDWQTVVTELHALSEKKTWIRESCWWAILIAVQSFHARQSQVSWDADAISWIVVKLLPQNEPESSWTAERVAIVCYLQSASSSRLVKGLDWTIHLSPTFKKPENILASRNLPALARILRESQVDESAEDSTASEKGKKKKDTPWKPQVHFAWNVILDRYVSMDESSKKKDTSSMTEFWRVAVDESLFAPSASPYRKSWGFALVKAILNKSQFPSTDVLSILFGSANSNTTGVQTNFMRCWVHNLKGNDRMLNGAARGVAAALQTFAAADPKIGITLVIALHANSSLGGGKSSFDSVTRTKTVEGILAQMTGESGASATKEYVQWLSRIFVKGGQDDAGVDSQRIWAIDQLVHLVRMRTVSSMAGDVQDPTNVSVVTSILELLIVHGLFLPQASKASLPTKSSKKNQKVEVHEDRSARVIGLSEPVRTACRSRLFTVLGDLTSQVVTVRVSEAKLVRASGSAADGESWLSKATRIIEALEMEVKSGSALARTAEPSSKLSSLRSRISTTRKRLSSVSEERSEAAKGAEALLLAFLLRTYEPESEVQEILEQSLEAVQHLFDTEKEASSRTKTEGQEEDPAPIDQVVDILVEMLDTTNPFDKKSSTFVFTHLTKEVKPSTIKFLIEQLEARDPDAHDDDDHSEDSDEEDEELAELSGTTLPTLGSDSEVKSDSTDEEEDSESESQSGSGSESESEESEDEDEDGGEADLELRRKIAEALGSNADVDDEEEEEFMDDDAMLEMDGQLAAVFKMQQGPRAEKKRVAGLRQAASHFKIRIIDLLDIYLRKRSDSPYVPAMVLPFLLAVRSARTNEEDFIKKSISFFNSRLVKPKDFPSDVDDATTVVQNLTEVHEICRKAQPSSITSCLPPASLYLARVLSSAGHGAVVAETYADSVEDFVTRKSSRITQPFLKSWIERQPRDAWRIRDRILSSCIPSESTPATEFRRLQAFQLLQTLLTSLSSIANDISADDLLVFLAGLSRSIISILEASSEQESNASGFSKPEQLKDVIRCALRGVNLTKRVLASSSTSGTPATLKSTSDVWDAAAYDIIASRLESSAELGKFKSVQTLCRQLVSTIAPRTTTSAEKAAKKNGVASKSSKEVASDETADENKKALDGESEAGRTGASPRKRKRKAEGADAKASLKKSKKTSTPA